MNERPLFVSPSAEEEEINICNRIARERKTKADLRTVVRSK